MHEIWKRTELSTARKLIKMIRSSQTDIFEAQDYLSFSIPSAVHSGEKQKQKYPF